ncbi:MAG: hypothetical protein U0457_07995 [Candidatus Sericytochromatia bacterium]
MNKIKVVFLSLFLFSFSLNSFAQNKIEKDNTKKETKKVKKTDFKTLNWRATSEDILKATTKKPKHKDNEKIVFDDNILGLEAEMTFFLTNNRFNKVKYDIKKKYNSNEEILKDILKIKKDFNKNYGKPKSDSNPEIEVLPRDDYDKFLKAILEQNQAIDIMWSKDYSEIKLNFKKSMLFFNDFSVTYSQI